MEKGDEVDGSSTVIRVMMILGFMAFHRIFHWYIQQRF